MSICPSCKDPDAYDGSYGWSCINKSCKFYDSNSSFFILNKKEEEKINEDPFQSCEEIHEFDGSSNYSPYSSINNWYRKSFLKIDENSMCEICNNCAGSHRASDGKCPVNGSYNFHLSDSFYKHPRS